MSNRLQYGLDLMRRMPPAHVEEHLYDLCDLAPDMIDDLLSCVDLPLKIAHDVNAGRDFLLCDYNRDGDSYRSPWSNKYYPALSGGVYPSDALRKLETEMNEAISVYRQLYFEGGVSSCYLWETGGDNLAGVVLIKKTQDQTKGGQPMTGSWDSIHVFEIGVGDAKATYKLTATVMLTLKSNTSTGEVIHLSGNMMKQITSTAPYDGLSSHIPNIGHLVERIENKLRLTTEVVYFGKTKDIVSELRSQVPNDVREARRTVIVSLNKALGGD